MLGFNSVLLKSVYFWVSNLVDSVLSKKRSMACIMLTLKRHLKATGVGSLLLVWPSCRKDPGCGRDVSMNAVRSWHGCSSDGGYIVHLNLGWGGRGG